MDKVKQGIRPNLLQLRELDKLKLKGYSDVIIEEADEATRYYLNVRNQLKKEEDNI